MTKTELPEPAKKRRRHDLIVNYAAIVISLASLAATILWNRH